MFFSIAEWMRLVLVIVMGVTAELPVGPPHTSSSYTEVLLEWVEPAAISININIGGGN